MNTPNFVKNENVLDTENWLDNYHKLVTEVFWQQFQDPVLFSGAHANLFFDIRHIFNTYRKQNKSKGWLKNELRGTFLWIEEIKSCRERKLAQKTYEASVDEVTFGKDGILRRQEQKQKQQEEIKALLESIKIVSSLMIPTNDPVSVTNEVKSVEMIVTALLSKRSPV